MHPELKAIVDKVLYAPGKPIGFAGDAILDQWYYCDVAPNPEAPTTPKLTPVRKSGWMPGGVLNAAAALRHLAEVRLATAMDAETADIADSVGLLIGESWRSGVSVPRKLRLCDLEGRALSRLDEESIILDSASMMSVSQGACKLALECGSLVLSDYGKGSLDEDAVSSITSVAAQKQVSVVLDTKRYWRRRDLHGAIAILQYAAPNAFRLTGEINPILAAKALSAATGSTVVVTCNSTPPVTVHSISGRVQMPAWLEEFRHGPEPFQPSGAGDSFAAFLALALSRGCDLGDAVPFAFVAASRAGSTGHFRSSVLPEEIERESPQQALLLRSRDALKRWASQRATGKLAVVNGCFDLLHNGHSRVIRAAAEHADQVLVLVNDDDYIRRKKGPARPAMVEAQRVEVLRGLAGVSAVAVFGADTAVESLRAIESARQRPADVLVKGEEYRDVVFPERQYADRVVFVPMTPLHSSDILRTVGEQHRVEKAR